MLKWWHHRKNLIQKIESIRDNKYTQKEKLLKGEKRKIGIFLLKWWHHHITSYLLHNVHTLPDIDIKFVLSSITDCMYCIGN